MKVTDLNWRSVCVCLMGEVRWRDAMRERHHLRLAQFRCQAGLMSPKLDDAPPPRSLPQNRIFHGKLTVHKGSTVPTKIILCLFSWSHFCLLSSSWRSSYRELIVLISCLLIIHGASLKAAPPALLLHSYFFLPGLLAHCTESHPLLKRINILLPTAFWQKILWILRDMLTFASFCGQIVWNGRSVTKFLSILLIGKNCSI